MRFGGLDGLHREAMRGRHGFPREAPSLEVPEARLESPGMVGGVPAHLSHPGIPEAGCRLCVLGGESTFSAVFSDPGSSRVLLVPLDRFESWRFGAAPREPRQISPSGSQVALFGAGELRAAWHLLNKNYKIPLECL